MFPDHVHAAAAASQASAKRAIAQIMNRADLACAFSSTHIQDTFLCGRALAGVMAGAGSIILVSVGKGAALPLGVAGAGTGIVRMQSVSAGHRGVAAIQHWLAMAICITAPKSQHGAALRSVGTLDDAAALTLRASGWGTVQRCLDAAVIAAGRPTDNGRLAKAMLPAFIAAAMGAPVDSPFDAALRAANAGPRTEAVIGFAERLCMEMDAI